MKYLSVLFLASIISLNAFSQTATKQYSFFHEKFLIFSTVKPYEEDARNTVSQLAFEAYSDIKRYSFMNMIKRGMISITVAEFKKEAPMYADDVLNQLIESYGSTPEFTANFSKSRVLDNSSFSGYQVSGRAYVKGKESSYIHLAVLTNNKTMMTMVAVYENVNDEIAINKILTSIKRKY